jgi:hypothetical protein
MVMKNLTLIQSRLGRWVVYSLILVGLVILLSSRSLSVSRDNGFDLSDPLVPREAIFHGGPPRDGIPSIDKPRFVRAHKASFLKPEDRVLGLMFDGAVRAYPIKILNYHEIVNDRINGQAIVISYCPLCGSGIAFKPEITDTNNTFGVSGLLYNSDMLLYDRDTESLWSQIMGTAISGKLKGKKLLTLVMTDTTWAHWLQQHPDTKVLSTKTGYWRDYDVHPYGEYDINRALYFPVSNTNARYHPKERVVGLTLGNKAKAYPFSELAKQRQTRFNDVFAGQTLTIDYNAASQSAVIYDAQHRPLPATTLFWFAWYAFHPDTEVFRAK